jgi:hypothetical protein
MTKNKHPSPNSSIYTDVWHCYQFCPFVTNCIALGPNFGLPNHFKCLKVLYSSSAGLKMGYRTKNEHPSSDSSICLMYGIFTNFGHFLPILKPWDPILGNLITLGV